MNKPTETNHLNNRRGTFPNLFIKGPLRNYPLGTERSLETTPTKREKQLTIEALPNVLIVHLKRFDALGSRKVTEVVDFPTDSPLDLGPFLSKWRAKANNKSSLPTPHLYELNAVVNHHGDANKGHYSSFVKDGGLWFLCDDHSIKHVDLETVKHSEGYLLFYIRKVMAVAS